MVNSLLLHIISLVKNMVNSLLNSFVKLWDHLKMLKVRAGSIAFLLSHKRVIKD